MLPCRRYKLRDARRYPSPPSPSKYYPTPASSQHLGEAVGRCQCKSLKLILPRGKGATLKLNLTNAAGRIHLVPAVLTGRVCRRDGDEYPAKHQVCRISSSAGCSDASPLVLRGQWYRILPNSKSGSSEGLKRSGGLGDGRAGPCTQCCATKRGAR